MRLFGNPLTLLLPGDIVNTGGDTTFLVLAAAEQSVTQIGQRVFRKQQCVVVTRLRVGGKLVFIEDIEWIERPP